MLNFIKKQSIANWLSLLAFILTIIGIILVAIPNSVDGYSMMAFGTVMACTIIAAVLIAAGVVLSNFFGAHNFLVVIVNAAALVLLMVAFYQVISARALLASELFSWNNGNETGWGVFYQSVAGLVMLFISAILLTVGGFFEDNNKTKAAA